MKIKWFGHACFLLTFENGTKWLMDPYNDTIGYPPIRNIEADVVTCSHQHFDHNYIEAAAGNPVVITDTGEYNVGDLTINGCFTWHDKALGAQRGQNIVYIAECSGVHVAHLGDLGHLPDGILTTELSGIDVLFIPVGGSATIDGAEAAELINMLKPGLAIPMHYNTSYCKPMGAKAPSLAPVEEFLDCAEGWEIERLKGSEFNIASIDDSSKILVFNIDK